MNIMRKVFLCLFFILMLHSASSAKSISPGFTEAEKNFIAEHPVIHMCVDPEFVPYEFIDSDGEYKGIAADYIKILSERTGIQMIAEKNLTWAEAYEAVVEKRLDVLPCIVKTPQRERYFLFSEPYFDFQRVIVVQDTNDSIKNFRDLNNKKAAVQKNSSHHSFMLSSHPETELSLYAAVEDALTAVSVGTEPAYIGNLATTNYLIKEHGFTNLKYIIVNTESSQSLYFAVRNDWPELVGIINKGLASITEEEKIEIKNKWLGIKNEVDYGPVMRVIAVIVFFLLISVFWMIQMKREIRKRILIEEELRRAKQEAEAANQIKSSFLARMSHEIRTPLNAITGMAYLTKKTDINATQKMYLDKIIQASYTMLGIINDILDFSKIEAGKVVLETISFNLDKVIQEVINIVSFRIEEQGIEFRMKKDPRIPVNFFGDPKRIEQILINLINNAVKFTDAGEVSLEVGQIEQTEESCVLEFRVRDTGIGMTESQLDQLFTPFSQGDSSINRRFGGTGLGLSIVKNLTEIMDGEISVESVSGEGSTFTIRLPLPIDLERNDEEKKKGLAISFKEIRALILDRSSTDRKLMESYLTSFGISADAAESERTALKLLYDAVRSDRPYQLLIVDYDTPQENGLEFAAMLKGNPLTSEELKTIILIPLMREDVFQKTEASGIEFGITKPVIPSVLYNGILELFGTGVHETTGKTISNTADEACRIGDGHQILVVEDNKTNQYIVKEILELAGFSVYMADNGEEGVRYYSRNSEKIDLILMDLHMPVMNGYEAAAEIRRMDSQVPIVAMTADAIAGIDEECKKAGIDYYISKPFDPDQFLETLHKILRPSRDGGKEVNSTVPGEQTDSGGTAYKNLELKTEFNILDVEDGLTRIGHNGELYQEILAEYRNEFMEISETLQEAIRCGKYEDAIQIVHKIKGASGNIGAKKVFLAASELQKALSEKLEESFDDLYRELDSSLRKLMQEIESYLAGSNVF